MLPFLPSIPATRHNLFVFFLTVFYTTITFAEEPVSLYYAKQSLIRYHDSGEYDKDIRTTMQKAMRYLQKRITQVKPDTAKRLAIVLDIDETALSNYHNMVKLGFGGSLEEIKKAEIKATDPAIQPTLQLYQFAKKHHVAVFFVTGRTENEREPTIKNLLKAGYQHWDGLILKPTSYKFKSISFFKTTVRKQLTLQGYHIVLNIGDQLSDLKGKYAEKTYKLPNPFYYLA